jgi:hypothetical protein
MNGITINLKKIELNKQHPISRITAISKGLHEKSASEKAGGLLETLFICKGCRVMLTNNLNVKFGLFNGSMGTVVDIVYPFDQIPKDC